MPHEIMEIGACKIDETGNILSSFKQMVKPKLYRRVDKYVKKVTGISEEELSRGKNFRKVFSEFMNWCGKTDVFMTWGRDDYLVLKRNLDFYEIDTDISIPIDIQKIYCYCFYKDINKQISLHAALDENEIDFEFPAHRAIYDAIATARIVPILKKKFKTLDRDQVTLLVTSLRKEQEDVLYKSTHSKTIQKEKREKANYPRKNRQEKGKEAQKS